MTTTQFIAILKKHWETLLTTAIAGALLGLLVSAAMPVKYQANMQLLILQRYAFARDAYTASKSIEYLSNVFGEAIYSENFIDEVLKSGYRIDNTFSPNSEERKKEWKSMVSAKISRDTGTMTIAVVNRSPDQAQQIAEAILNNLSSKGDEYHGEGDRVKIQVLDAPALSQTPAQPNVPANTAAGVVVAVVIAFTVLATGTEFEFTPATIKHYFFPNNNGVIQDPAEQFTPAPEGEARQDWRPAPQYVFETVQTPYVTPRANDNDNMTMTMTEEASSIGFSERPGSINEIKRKMGLI